MSVANDDGGSCCTNQSRMIPRIAPTSIVRVADDDDSSGHHLLIGKNDDDMESYRVMIPQEMGDTQRQYLICRIQNHSSASTVAKVANLVSQLSHPNIVEIHGMGGGDHSTKSKGHYLLISAWDETLRSKLATLEQQKQSPSNSPHKYLNKFLKRKKNKTTMRKYQDQQPSSVSFYEWNLWHHIALPLTRVFCYLHSQNVAFGRLTLDSIVVKSSRASEGQSPPSPPLMMLQDFSQARSANEATKEDLDLDIFDLGMIFEEFYRIHPMPEDSIQSHVTRQLIECCCHPSNPPSARRVHKRLLEVLRHMPISVFPDMSPDHHSAMSIPPEIQLEPLEKEQQKTKRKGGRNNTLVSRRVPAVLSGFRHMPQRSPSPSKENNTNSSQCPTETSSIPSEPPSPSSSFSSEETESRDKCRSASGYQITSTSIEC